MVNHGVSPAIPHGAADFVLGFEPVETARALPFISARSMVLMNTAPIVPYALSQQYVRGQGTGEYPDVGRLSESIRAVTRTLVTFDATALAERTGSSKTLNVVMLGCLFGAGAFPFAPDDFMNTVMKTAPAMLAGANMEAFQLGVEFGQSVQLVEGVS
jgi:indolepyruvate ferredoxin oxidoreductase beta subunit